MSVQALGLCDRNKIKDQWETKALASWAKLNHMHVEGTPYLLHTSCSGKRRNKKLCTYIAQGLPNEKKTTSPELFYKSK